MIPVITLTVPFVELELSCFTSKKSYSFAEENLHVRESGASRVENRNREKPYNKRHAGKFRNKLDRNWDH